MFLAFSEQMDRNHRKVTPISDSLRLENVTHFTHTPLLITSPSRLKREKRDALSGQEQKILLRGSDYINVCE